MYQSSILSFLPILFALVTASASSIAGGRPREGSDSGRRLGYSSRAKGPSATESRPSLIEYSKLYGDDGLHPSRMGTYLAALVLFEQITGRSPVGTPAVVDGSGAADLRILKASAAEAIRNFARP